MRIVVQRVSDAVVVTGGEEVARIGVGLVALVGVAPTDTLDTATRMAGRLVRLRVFESGDGAERALADGAGELLVVSQFTLLADTRRGNRPSWSPAAPAAVAEPIVATLAAAARAEGVACATGVFGASMQLRLTNDGPLTLVLDSSPAPPLVVHEKPC